MLLSVSSATGLVCEMVHFLTQLLTNPMAGFILYLTSLDLMRDKGSTITECM